MNEALAIETDDEDDMRERRDVVSGEVLPEGKLIRFAVSPDGEVVPDIAAILPGRGIWVEADRKSVDIAVKKNLFAKSAKANVKAASDLATKVETLLVARMQADLGMARRSGQLVTGFDKVLGEIQSATPPALIVEAWDGAADGKRKLFGAAHARGLKIETVEPLSSAEISLAVGRENVIHAALKSGRLQERLSFDAKRLSGFRNVPSAVNERDE
ncbi:MAG TPA: RNA-binding protein [Rhizomicrobium sp.]|nr:RNA-binding protein [Rhizomicrobium sp.]